jgi:hypothetical protein
MFNLLSSGPKLKSNLLACFDSVCLGSASSESPRVASHIRGIQASRKRWLVAVAILADISVVAPNTLTIDEQLTENVMGINERRGQQGGKCEILHFGGNE